MTRRITTPTAAATTPTYKTAQEIQSRRSRSSSLFSCKRCGKDLELALDEKSSIFRNFQKVRIMRSVTLTLPPEKGKTRPKEYYYLMCRWCVTEFLKFMQEKEKQGGEEEK